MSTNQTYEEKYGSWALVTGASSGIGREYALQLAAKGLNIAIAARRKDRLGTLAKELEENYRVQTRVLVADLTSPDYLAQIQANTEDIEIGLLVNSAGTGAAGNFLKQPLAKRTQNIQLNVLAPMQLTYVFAEKMRQRGRGGIVFISSLAGLTGMPNMANYAATKSYIISLAHALHTELKEAGIDVLVLSAGAIRTEFNQTEGMKGMDLSKTPNFWMDPDELVEIGINALGKKAAVVPGSMNRIMAFMTSRLLPRQVVMNMFNSSLRKTLDPSLLL